MLVVGSIKIKENAAVFLIMCPCQWSILGYFRYQQSGGSLAASSDYTQVSKASILLVCLHSQGEVEEEAKAQEDRSLGP